MRIAIVGAGNIGTVFAARLIDAGHEVSLVARGARFAELESNGLRLRHQMRKRVEQYSAPVHRELTPELSVDLILVTVQRHHIEALLPALAAHPCARICFMFNCSEIDPAWQRMLGARLVWGFPSALASTKHGVVEYAVLPGWLRGLQITTVGVAEGGDAAIAREIVEVLQGARIATVFHPHMPSWLMTHTALMLPGMAVGESKYRRGAPQTLAAREARLVARAQKECFATVRAAGARVTPLNMKLLARVPAFVVAAAYWLLSRTSPYRRNMLGHVDHARGEMRLMYEGVIAHASRSGTPTTSLDELCASLGASAAGPTN